MPAARKSNKPRTAKKPTAISKPKVAAKPKPPAFEIWRCHVEWVKHHGKRYVKGDILNISMSTLADDAEMKLIRKYFTPMKTESVSMVSDPIEVLKEGD